MIIPSKANFLSYKKVQMSGRYNMVMDAKQAAAAARLDLDIYFAVIQNYSKLQELYG